MTGRGFDGKDALGVLTDEQYERFERDMPGAMRAAVGEFQGPSADLVRRGIERGRRQRRAMVVRCTVGGAVLAVLAAGGLVVGTGAFSGDADSGRGSAAADSSRDLAAYVRQVLPPGARFVADESVPGSGPQPFVAQRVSVQGMYVAPDGGEKLSLSVAIRRPVPASDGTWPDKTVCGAAELRPDACRRVPQADGGVLTTRKTSVAPNQGGGESGGEGWMVAYQRTDGVQIQVEAEGQVLPGTAVGSLLGVERLTAMAMSPVWTPVAAQLATPERQLPAILGRSLPPGMRLASWGGELDNWYVVETAEGRSTLTVGAWVRATGKPEGCPASPSTDTRCEMVTLSDGTSARVERAVTKDGETALLTLTAFRSRGLVVQLATGEYGKSDVFAGQRLDIDDLKAVAASPRWDD